MKVRYSFIEQKAEELRQKVECIIPTPVESLVTMNGIVLKTDAELDGDVSGFSLSENGKKAISVRSSDSILRKRFTIAHELAHLLLHEDRTLNINTGSVILFRNQHSKTGEDWREIEANHFAACLLMPKSALVKELAAATHGGSVTENTIEHLALHFEVSVQAMSVRLAVLGVSL